MNAQDHPAAVTHTNPNGTVVVNFEPTCPKCGRTFRTNMPLHLMPATFVPNCGGKGCR